MKTTLFHLLPVGIGIVMLGMMTGGCLTATAWERQGMREREDQLILQEENRRLAGRIETVELDQQRLTGQLDRLRADSIRTTSAQIEVLENRLAALEQRISAMETAREKDKQEIIEKLSQTVTQIVKSSSSGGSSKRSSRKSSSEYGWEHTVGAGETLSEIAREYGVSTSVIVEENGLTNPDNLKVGQKLFIPE